MEKENLHEGHRARTIDTFLKNPTAFPEHVMLEILLYSVIPRVDTNPLAHRLINKFGSLESVFNATASQLMTVEGVGKKVAAHITVISAINKSIKIQELFKLNKKKYINVHDIYPELKSFFEELEEEKFVVIFLNKFNQKLAVYTYNSSSIKFVSIDLIEIARDIVTVKPAQIILAHNHPSGEPTPSANDDLSTKKLNAICSVHGTNLVDHIIYAKDEYYSYNEHTTWKAFKESSSIENLLLEMEK